MPGYTITSNPQAILAARGLIGDKGSRPRTVLLDGARLIRDAVAAVGPPMRLFFSSRSIISDLNTHEYPEVYYVPHNIIKRWSAVKNPSGIMAIFEIPTINKSQYVSETSQFWSPLPVSLILDQIRDPGNMGSLIRTAAGFGLTQVLVTEGSVDIWNEKVIRAGMSGHFVVPVYQNLDWTSIISLLGSNTEHPLSSNCIKVHVTGPQSLSNGPQSSEGSFENEDIVGSESSPYDEASGPLSDGLRETESGSELDRTSDAFSLPLDVAPHFKIEHFTHDRSISDQDRPHIAIVIGSEVNGVSPQAHHLAHLTGGQHLVVPCCPRIESLNVSSATSAILSEVQRQYLQFRDVTAS